MYIYYMCLYVSSCVYVHMYIYIYIILYIIYTYICIMASQKYHVPSKHHWQIVTRWRMLRQKKKQKAYQIRKLSFNCLIGRQRLIREASHRERCRSAVSVYPLGTSLLTILVSDRHLLLGCSVKLQDDCVNTWLTITRLSTQFYNSIEHQSSTLDIYL